MWTRKELKERAKLVLKRIYWKAFWISIVIALASGNIGRGGGGDRNWDRSNGNFFSPDIPDSTAYLGFLIIAAVVIGIILLSLALRIFIGYPLEVGGRKYFIQSAQELDNTRCFKFAFNGNNYLGIVLTMLLKGIKNFLWFLLLIIPGIIKYYAYSMVPYILADNPNIGSKKAINLSKQMTDGHKFNMFVLDLSFIGWYLLGLLALVIGMFFVMPYENATKAELYLVLRKNAIDSGMCSYEDLMLEH